MKNRTSAEKMLPPTDDAGYKLFSTSNVSRFTVCGMETLFTSLRCEPEAFFDKTSFDGCGGTVMVERGLYYATADFARGCN